MDTSKQVGGRDHLKVFANADAAEAWLAENDPEGVAFEYEVTRSNTQRKISPSRKRSFRARENAEFDPG